MTSWADEAELRNWLIDYLVTTIGCSPEEIHLDAPLNELGVGSRDAVVLAGELSELLGRTVSPVDFWQNPTITSLAHGLLNPDAEPPAHKALSEGSLHEPIAVIGVGCRLPGEIHGSDNFWQFLADGRSAIGEVPGERWQQFDDGTPETRAVLDRVTRWGSFLADVAAFDAEYFDISPGEADRIDPQQRLLLEVAVEALDNAGVPAETLARTQTGVFVGACVSEYGFLASADLPRIDAWTGTGGALSIIANRLSYFLDARGPSVTVDTACSSSLVAIHLACRSLRLGESDLALAAGGCSRIRCAFVPPKPKDDTPANRGRPVEGHVVGSSTTLSRSSSNGMCGLGVAKCRLAGIRPRWTARVALMKPTTPAAASR